MHNFQQDLTLQGARRRLWDHPGTLLAKQVSRLIFQIRFTDVCWFGVAVGLHFRTFWLTFDALAGSLGPPWSASGNRLKRSQKTHFGGPPFRPPFHYIFLLFWCFVFVSFCNLSPTSFLVPKRLQALISKVPRGAKKHKKTREKGKGESEGESEDIKWMPWTPIRPRLRSRNADRHFLGKLDMSLKIPPFELPFRIIFGTFCVKVFWTFCFREFYDFWSHFTFSCIHLTSNFGNILQLFRPSFSST